MVVWYTGRKKVERGDEIVCGGCMTSWWKLESEVVVVVCDGRDVYMEKVCGGWQVTTAVVSRQRWEGIVMKHE
jgi:hypothetical protein